MKQSKLSMARGGAREGAGRKPGKTLRLLDLLKQEQIDNSLNSSSTTTKKDARLMMWMGDHIFGKAPQAITGPDGGPIQLQGVDISIRRK
jgi:hypothetical protein